MDLINILFAKALNNGDATKEYVNEAIAALKGEVNADLDTLEELSKALGNDPDFFLTVKNEIDSFKTELVTGKDTATENTRFAIGIAEQTLEVPSMEEFNQLKDEKLSEPTEGLAVGKYFRVAALDENGHAVLEAVDAPKEGLALTPTGWPEWTADEQAAARARIGIPGEYELIEEITLEEDVKSIIRATEPDGKAYNFKSILFEMEVPSGVVHNNTYWFIKNESTVLCYPNRPILSKSMVTYFQCGAERKNGFLIGWNNAGNTQIGKDGGTSLQYNLCALLTDLSITNIEIRAGDTFVSGEKFRIYGVRA